MARNWFALAFCEYSVHCMRFSQDGKSALEIAEYRASSSREAQKCYNLLKENSKSLVSTLI